MDEEIFISGYCRCLDSSRTVAAEKEDRSWQIDCGYGSCPYEDRCTIAQRIRELTEN